MPMNSSSLNSGHAQAAHNLTTPPHDWTEDLPHTEHVDFFRNVDWSSTELGATINWEPALRMYTHMVMSDSRAATLYWGPNQVAIYNEHFAPLAAGRHPELMGQTFQFGFPELYPYMSPLFAEAWQSGVAQDVVEAPMMVERNGYKEEAFFTGNFAPIRGMDGKVVGLYNALFEVTKQKIQERRTNLLNLLAAIPGRLSIAEVYSYILTSLREDSNDIPMAILYEADTPAESKPTVLRLQGQIGLPSNHGLLRDGRELDDNDDIIAIFRQATTERVITMVDAQFDGIEWLGFEHPSENVVTMSLTTGVRLFGFLTIGTNPFRPFDEACEQFIKDLRRMISGIIASAWDADDLRKKQQLLQSELEFSDMKVRHLVQHTSVGMAHAKPDGTIIWANDKFFSLAEQTSKVNGLLDNIYEVFLDEDRAKVEQMWAGIIDGGDHVSIELRLKRTFLPPVGDPEPAHVQMMAFPYSERGKIISTMACITDISRLKWAEAWQTRLAKDAREAKLQQERFIDMVSHEMRNPLSAIFHSAETVVQSLNEVQLNVTESLNPPTMAAVEESVSAAMTILDCARHQKRIIDDILTLGRLESTLLSVKPSAVKPSELVGTVLSLFESELRSSGISTRVVPDSSITDLNIEYLYLDPSRVTQIFLNLFTNAIKFVKMETDRNIDIRFAASTSPPRSNEDGKLLSEKIHWAPKGRTPIDVMAEPIWGNGEILYLTFSVTDTGIGMHETEIVKIFERFEQASVKTFVTYGGSGLGLYISKELTETMGGEIGVSSQPGKGSRFVFYIKTRRAKEVNGKEHGLPFRSLSYSTPTPTEEGKSPMKVLLVEDNLINQRVLTKHLAKGNFHVEVANHGVEALEILCKPDTHFDVILMDVQMPIMDGLTCTTEIRKLEKLGSLQGRRPIIAVTANVRQERINDAVASGVDRVLQKPFKAATLIAMIRELVADPLHERNHIPPSQNQENGKPVVDDISTPNLSTEATENLSPAILEE